VIDKTKMSDQYKKNLQMETDILRKVRHPNIIQMSEIYETDEYLFLVMELVTGGELFDKIIEKGCYTEKEAAVLVHKIVSAIDYLHDMDICHRDLVSQSPQHVFSFFVFFAIFLTFCFFFRNRRTCCWRRRIWTLRSKSPTLGSRKLFPSS
jgi:hypothetical protein